MYVCMYRLILDTSELVAIYLIQHTLSNFERWLLTLMSLPRSGTMFLQYVWKENILNQSR